MVAIGRGKRGDGVLTGRERSVDLLGVVVAAAIEFLREEGRSDRRRRSERLEKQSQGSRDRRARTADPSQTGFYKRGGAADLLILMSQQALI